jgi:UDP-glucose 4-epimerase
VKTDRRWFIVGGAGFIGGHFVDRLLELSDDTAVTIYDNFSSGRAWHFADHVGDPRFAVVRGEVADTTALCAAMEDHDVVLHLASNPDIAAAMTNPDIDFLEGTALTRSVVEAMRLTGVLRILFASGSGVYGDLGEREAFEDYGPLVPVSTYGASKLAGEALIASYTAMFELRACVFRFGNVVGSRQTHGVGFDFIRKLSVDPSRLDILGDGSQSKSYIHIDDVIAAVLTADARTARPYEAYNVATGDYITVRDIADLAVQSLGLSPENVEYQFRGGPRGWKGDVPIVRLDTTRIRALGWRCERTSREALSAAMRLLVDDARAGRL